MSLRIALVSRRACIEAHISIVDNFVCYSYQNREIRQHAIFYFFSHSAFLSKPWFRLNLFSQWKIDLYIHVYTFTSQPMKSLFHFKAFQTDAIKLCSHSLLTGGKSGAILSLPLAFVQRWNRNKRESKFSCYSSLAMSNYQPISINWKTIGPTVHSPAHLSGNSGSTKQTLLCLQ